MDNAEQTQEVKIEQIGLIPIILDVLNRIDLIKKVNAEYGRHGNWKGTSKGALTAVWICYIISECDHRLCRLEDWVRQNGLSINGYLKEFGHSITPKDCTMVRLELLLEDFSKEGKWRVLERKINRSFISVYDLESDVIQLDATIGQSFKKVIEDGLFQYGFSKHDRKDLPQLKIMLANLVGGNMPLATITVSGEQADDVLYIQMIIEAKKSLTGNGLLWVGDVKLGSIENRSYIESIGDYYFSPLSKVQVPINILHDKYLLAILNKTVELEEIERDGVVIATGYETTEEVTHEGKSWLERRLVVCSKNYKTSQEESLEARIAKAYKNLLGLNTKKQGKKKFKEESSLREACKKIEKKYNVEGFLEVDCRIRYKEQQLRAYKNKPARVVQQMEYDVVVRKNKQAIEQHKRTLGWRVYATNKSIEKLPLSKAINLYRDEYKIERRIRNLKEEVTALLPFYLKKDNRIEALINLLVLVLKVISVIENDIAKTLKEQKRELGGLYEGNRHITTATPTISKIKEAFKTASVAYIMQGQKVIQVLIPKLTTVQKEILELLGLSTDIFKKLGGVVPVLESS